MSAEAIEPKRANRAQRAVMAASGTQQLSSEALSVLASVPEWWRRRAKAAGIRSPWGLDVYSAVNAKPPVDMIYMAFVSPRGDLFEAEPSVLTDAYVVALDSEVRTAEGRHYTPPALATALYERAVAVAVPAPDGSEGSDAGGLSEGQDPVSDPEHVPDGFVWDPAAGAGALLLPALRDWLAKQEAVQPDITLTRVSVSVGGRDLDAAAVWLGSVVLAAELLDLWQRVPPRRRQPLPALLQVGDGLSAPPARPTVTILNPPYGRVRLDEADRKAWAHVLAGHANRYQLFLASAVDHAAETGTVAALIPAGWLGGKYFQLLRKHLASAAPLVRVTYIADRSGVFSTGVLQETVLAVFRRQTDRTVTCEQITLNGVLTCTTIGHGTIPADTSLPWLLPRSHDDSALVEAAGRMTHRLKDYHWKVTTGPLVWNRHKDQLSAFPGPRSCKLIWAADLDGGKLHQDPSRNKMRWAAMRNNKSDERTLTLAEPAVLVQRTTAPEQSRRLVAAALDADALQGWGGRVAVENHVNVLRCSNDDSVLTPQLLTALLDSEAVDRLYRCLTGSVAVSAYELAALPLPDAKTLQRLSGLDGPALPLEIDRVYGLMRDAEQPEPGPPGAP